MAYDKPNWVGITKNYPANNQRKLDSLFSIGFFWLETEAQHRHQPVWSWQGGWISLLEPNEKRGETDKEVILLSVIVTIRIIPTNN